MLISLSGMLSACTAPMGIATAARAMGWCNDLMCGSLGRAGSCRPEAAGDTEAKLLCICDKAKRLSAAIAADRPTRSAEVTETESSGSTAAGDGRGMLCDRATRLPQGRGQGKKNALKRCRFAADPHRGD